MSYIGSDFYTNIARGRYANIAPWSKIGYNPSVSSTEEDVWSKGDLYGSKAANLGRFPAAASTLNVKSSDADDVGTAIRGTLPATPLTCDAGGTTTRLVDASEDFNAGTAVAVGDILIVDPYETATTPEWAIITAVDAAGDYVDFAGGLSSGGSCATARKYFILDTSATAGAMAVKIEYLTSAYAPYSEIVCLNGQSNVLTQNQMFRINSFRVIAIGSYSGTTGASQGAIEIDDDADATLIWSYITAGYSRARNNMYTVPAGKTLYLVEWNTGWASPNESKVQSIRMMLKANREPATGFLTNDLFYTYTELHLANQQVSVMFPIPTKFAAKTDIKVAAQATNAAAAGAVTSVLRGWLE